MPRRKCIQYRENPFLPVLYEESQPRMKKVTAPTNDFLVSSQKEGVSANAQVGLIFQHEMEANEFVKMYAKGIAEMWELNSAGKKVFTVLFEIYSGKAGKDTDIIMLHYPSLPEEIKKIISYRVFTSGINNLIEHKFIAESTFPAQFYINPTFFFNGDRLAIIHLYQKKKTSEINEKFKQLSMFNNDDE